MRLLGCGRANCADSDPVRVTLLTVKANAKIGTAGPLWLPGAIGLTVLLFLLVVAKAKPPAAKPGDAPEAEFSAVRALEVLGRLVGAAGTKSNGTARPHPFGSAANARVRDQVVEEFLALDFECEVDRVALPSGWSTWADVENVVARLPGPASTGGQGSDGQGDKGVLLVAHYDSVGAGPGAGDDLSGVACIIEALRAFRAKGGRALHGPLMVLISDGEEAGLFGADAFVRAHPWMNDVGVVINLEARGTSGGSILFETGANNRWLLELYRDLAPRPLATSYSVEIYRRMSNDTDFSPFREAGLPGLNFAFIGSHHDYHTPNDSLERLSADSLQHHGENLLPIVRALASMDLAEPPKGDLVYIDVLSRFMVAWPATWNVALCAIAVFLFVVGVARQGARTSSGTLFAWFDTFRGALGAAFTLAVAGLAGELLGLFLRGGEGRIGALYPLPVWAAYASLAWLTATCIASLAGSLERIQSGILVLFLIGLLLTTGYAPGASVLFALPLALPLVSFVLGVGSSHPLALLLLWASSAICALVWSPLVHGVPQAFGFGLGGAMTALILVSSPWIAVLARASRPGPRLAVQVILALVCAVATFYAWTQPRISADVPGPLTFHHFTDTETEEAFVVADSGPFSLPDALEEEFTASVPSHFRGAHGTGGSIAAPAQAVGLEAPRLELVEEEWTEKGRRLVVWLASPAQANLTLLRFERRVRMLGVRREGEGALEPLEESGATGAGESREEAPPNLPRQAWTFLGVPPEGLFLELEIEGEGPLAASALDQHLSPSEIMSETIDALREACGPQYVPRRIGDSIIVRAALTL